MSMIKLMTYKNNHEKVLGTELKLEYNEFINRLGLVLSQYIIRSTSYVESSVI